LIYSSFNHLEGGDSATILCSSETPTWSPTSSSGAPSTTRAWTCCRGSRGVPQKCSESLSTCPMRKDWDRCSFYKGL